MTDLIKKACKKKIKKLCPVCHGKGEYETARDLHQSAGIVPCHHCKRTGYVSETSHDK